MGNRAIIKFRDETAKDVGVYLHWNGGPESVLAFLKVMEERKWTRLDYASARFIGVVVEYFDLNGDDLGYSVGILQGPEKYFGLDNGIYEVDLNSDLKSKDKRLSWFKVRQNGKVVKKFDKDDQLKFDHIVAELAASREKRIVISTPTK